MAEMGIIPRTAYFKGQTPADSELDALEQEIDDLRYCGNDVLILIAEVRRLRTTFRSAFGLMGKIASQAFPDAECHVQGARPAQEGLK